MTGNQVRIFGCTLPLHREIRLHNRDLNAISPDLITAQVLLFFISINLAEIPRAPGLLRRNRIRDNPAGAAHGTAVRALNGRRVRIILAAAPIPLASHSTSSKLLNFSREIDLRACRILAALRLYRNFRLYQNQCFNTLRTKHRKGNGLTAALNRAVECVIHYSDGGCVNFYTRPGLVVNGCIIKAKTPCPVKYRRIIRVFHNSLDGKIIVLRYFRDNIFGSGFERGCFPVYCVFVFLESQRILRRSLYNYMQRIAAFLNAVAALRACGADRKVFFAFLARRILNRSGLFLRAPSLGYVRNALLICR